MANVNGSRRTKLVSDFDREVCDVVNFVFIVSAISLFGVVANVMNMVVFYTQGFSNNMNISFFAMAISDMCGLLTILWTGICSNPMFVQSDVPIVPIEVQYLTAAVPRSGFGRITGWLTVYITAERCLCITYPLKIKHMVTPKRTAAIVCTIYLVVVLDITSYLNWKFYPETNRTLVGLVFTEYKAKTKGIMYILYSTLGSASFVAVVVFTAVLVIQLKQKSKWRKTANADKTSSESISSRDWKTMHMVVMIATVLIVCYIPGASVSMVTFFEPEFSIVGLQVNVLLFIWSFIFIFEAVNSSVNIFLYYNMSSKYRETFNQVFGNCATEK